MQDFLLTHGVWVLGIIFLADDLGIPLPVGTFLFFSSILARTVPEIHVWQLLLIAVCVPQIGNQIMFRAGQRGARKWLKIHGHRFFLPEKRLNRMQTFFDKKHGWFAMFLVSMVSNMRVVFSLLAGSSKMNPLKFWSANFAGILCWASMTIGAGYFLGEHAREIFQHEWKTALSILIALVTAWSWAKLIRQFFKLHRKK